MVVWDHQRGSNKTWKEGWNDSRVMPRELSLQAHCQHNFISRFILKFNFKVGNRASQTEKWEDQKVNLQPFDFYVCPKLTHTSTLFDQNERKFKLLKWPRWFFYCMLKKGETWLDKTFFQNSDSWGEQVLLGELALFFLCSEIKALRNTSIFNQTISNSLRTARRKTEVEKKLPFKISTSGSTVIYKQVGFIFVIPLTTKF